MPKPISQCIIILLARSCSQEQAAATHNSYASNAEAPTDQTATAVLGLKTEKRKNPKADTDPLLVKNTNAQQVLDAEKLKREKSKQDSEAKKVCFPMSISVFTLLNFVSISSNAVESETAKEECN